MALTNGILLFDGFCVLCSFFARKLLVNYGQLLQLVPVQSDKGVQILKSYGLPLEMPDEVLLVCDSGIYKGYEAIVFIMRNGTFWWRTTGTLLNWLPKRILSWLYQHVARNRYIWFGKRQKCYLG